MKGIKSNSKVDTKLARPNTCDATFEIKSDNFLENMRPHCTIVQSLQRNGQSGQRLFNQVGHKKQEDTAKRWQKQTTE